MDASPVQALSDITPLLQSEGPVILETTLEGMGGALGSAFVKKGILPKLKKGQKADKEPIAGLYSTLAFGIGRALSVAVQDEHDALVSDEVWKRYGNLLLNLTSRSLSLNTTIKEQ